MQTCLFDPEGNGEPLKIFIRCFQINTQTVEDDKIDKYLLEGNGEPHKML